MYHAEVVAPESRPGCFAVKVRNRGEVTVSGALRQKGYDVLLPTYVDSKQYSDRVKKSSRALFPGYVFVRFDPQNLLGLVSTEGVSYIVRSGSALKPLPAEEELALEGLAGLSEECEPCAGFHVGQQVQIKSGPLKNRQGTLVRVGGRERVVISLNSIFSSVSVDVRDIEVARCDS